MHHELILLTFVNYKDEAFLSSSTMFLHIENLNDVKALAHEALKSGASPISSNEFEVIFLLRKARLVSGKWMLTF